MARGDNETIVTQSVLDRLIDDEPSNQLEAPLTRAQSVRALRAAVRRDLEWLLNSRRTPQQATEAYPELSHSLYNYGLPDFTTLTLANPRDRKRLLSAIESTVRLFEPRIGDARVIPVETENGDGTRSIRFQIEGLLKMDPAPEHVSFDTVLQVTSGEYEVNGERGA